MANDDAASPKRAGIPSSILAPDASNNSDELVIDTTGVPVDTSLPTPLQQETDQDEETPIDATNIDNDPHAHTVQASPKRPSRNGVLSKRRSPDTFASYRGEADDVRPRAMRGAAVHPQTTVIGGEYDGAPIYQTSLPRASGAKKARIDPEVAPEGPSLLMYLNTTRDLMIRTEQALERAYVSFDKSQILTARLLQRQENTERSLKTTQGLMEDTMRAFSRLEERAKDISSPSNVPLRHGTKFPGRTTPSGPSTPPAPAKPAATSAAASPQRTTVFPPSPPPALNMVVHSTALPNAVEVDLHYPTRNNGTDANTGAGVAPAPAEADAESSKIGPSSSDNSDINSDVKVAGAHAEEDADSSKRGPPSSDNADINSSVGVADTHAKEDRNSSKTPPSSSDNESSNESEAPVDGLDEQNKTPAAPEIEVIILDDTDSDVAH